MNKKIISIVSIVLVVALLATVLCACNAESVQNKLKKAGYTVLTSEQIQNVLHVDPSEDATVEWMVVAGEGDFDSLGGLLKFFEGNFVTVTKFNKTDDAKAAEAEAKKGVVEGETTVKRVGKIVYSGTVEAVKAAK